MSFNALVLAGARAGVADPVAAHAGVSDKALVLIGARTMLARVVAALRAAGAARIVVVSSSPAVAVEAHALEVETLAAAAGPSASAASGFALLAAPLLVTTADHALLRPEWIRQLLDEALGDADVAALLAPRSAIERDVPPTARTYFRFADGAWSGCNLFLLATPAATGAITLWQQVERDRKRPWRIIRRLGFVLLLRYLTGRLTLTAALDRLGAVAGARIRIVESASGLAAVDVDTPADLDLVRRLVADGAD